MRYISVLVPYKEVGQIRFLGGVKKIEIRLLRLPGKSLIWVTYGQEKKKKKDLCNIYLLYERSLTLRLSVIM